MPNSNIDTDVAIIGGGLAGLTLAIHLRQRNPELSIHVIERREHPVREAAFKVGESTVEIGAHYLAEVLGLREHLDRCHLRKFGFRFFFSDGREDIDRCLEIGVSRVLPTPSWQIDRGRFENFLGEHARSIGVQFDSGATVRRIGLESAEGTPHWIDFERNGQNKEQRLSTHWIIDASGRAALLKRKLGLARANRHDTNAVWWRVAGHVDPHDWSTDHEWLTRCDPPDRWRSTNHMCGPGYWVWLIPLASGSHSIGIVCDAKMHPLEQMNSHRKAMLWMQARQPRVARALTEERHVVQDFGYLRHYSHDCAQILSAERWAITGEAGLFLDPFYSPGTDFIAIANTYICDLIERDMKKEAITARTMLYEQMFRSFYENMLTLYQDQYRLFGNAQIMPVKVIWDYTYYWALLAPLFFTERLTDISALSKLRDHFVTGCKLNLQMQKLFSDWRTSNWQKRHSESIGRLLDQHQIDWFYEMNRALTDPYDSDEFENLISSNVAKMQCLSQEIDSYAQAHFGPKSTDISTNQQTIVIPKNFKMLQPEWYGKVDST